MTDLTTVIKNVLKDVILFSHHVSGTKLRSYQMTVAAAIADSVINKKGLSFVVVFPRQSGKNELQAQIETYLLTLLQRINAEIVKVSPTWKPQSLNAMRRLERVLKRNLLSKYEWEKESGYIYRVGNARIYFLSGGQQASIVGATASTLLECDEAQDVLIPKWDKEIAPMAASTNATRVFWGTAWTSETLLAREKRSALELEKQDGVQRVFQITADQVREEVPAYGKFVDHEIATHGRNNPFIRTQYFSEEIDAYSGMFTADRLALMQGNHAPLHSPAHDAVYAFCIDVGGEDFDNEGNETNTAGKHDSTALTIIEVKLPENDLLPGPFFQTVYRKTWIGTSTVKNFRQISAMVNLWQPNRIIVDATGVGEGLTSFLLTQFLQSVIPFKFTQASKSELGWKFISLIETGRYKEYHPESSYTPEGDHNLIALQSLFWEQCRRCSYEIIPGPGKILKWSVPDGARSYQTGELLHDDLLLSAALCAGLDEEPWGNANSAIIKPFDPLKEMRY